MKNYSYLFFDLDGTLTDPAVGITNSVMYALDRQGIHVGDRSELYKFIGPPLIDSFREFYGFSDERAREAVKDYREHFSAQGIFENEVYPGIPALLERLRSAGYRLIVATSKPEHFAVRIVEHFGLDGYFDFVAGAAIDETRTNKWEVIDYAIERAGITDRSRILMIGDRKHDVLGAKKCGIPCLGVLFGYGDRAEHEQAGALAIAETVEDIGRYILEN